MALGIALGIARAGVGAYQMMQGNAMATQGMRDAARFGQQIANTRFINKFAALQAPIKGARLAMQNVSRAAQMGIQAAKEGGLRGVIGGAGRIESAVGDQAAKIAAQLDNIQLQIDNKFLTEEQKTDLRNKQKDLGLAYERLKGAQAAQTAGGTMAMSGLGQVVTGLGQTIGGLVERSDLYKDGDIPEGADVKDLTRKQRRSLVDDENENTGLRGMKKADRKKFQAQSKAGEVLEIQDDISTLGEATEITNADGTTSPVFTLPANALGLDVADSSGGSGTQTFSNPAGLTTLPNNNISTDPNNLIPFPDPNNPEDPNSFMYMFDDDIKVNGLRVTQ